MKFKTTFCLRILLVTFTLQGCMSSRLLQTDDSDQLIARQETHWNFFWGLKPEVPIEAGCGEENICWVESRTNFGFILLSCVSLGIVVPQQIVWQCCPEDPDVEDLDN